MCIQFFSIYMNRVYCKWKYVHTIIPFGTAKYIQRFSHVERSTFNNSILQFHTFLLPSNSFQRVVCSQPTDLYHLSSSTRYFYDVFIVTFRMAFARIYTLWKLLEWNEEKSNIWKLLTWLEYQTSLASGGVKYRLNNEVGVDRRRQRRRERHPLHQDRNNKLNFERFFHDWWNFRILNFTTCFYRK